MSGEQLPKEERCNCPSGSYSIKHTNACYEARIERLQKDASKYRWLISQPVTAVAEPIQKMWFTVGIEGRPYPTPEEWDAAIEASMEKQS